MAWLEWAKTASAHTLCLLHRMPWMWKTVWRWESGPDGWSDSLSFCRSQIPACLFSGCFNGQKIHLAGTSSWTASHRISHPAKRSFAFFLVATILLLLSEGHREERGETVFCLPSWWPVCILSGINQGLHFLSSFVAQLVKNLPAM